MECLFRELKYLLPYQTLLSIVPIVINIIFENFEKSWVFGLSEFYFYFGSCCRAYWLWASVFGQLGVGWFEKKKWSEYKLIFRFYVYKYKTDNSETLIWSVEILI